MKNQKKGLQNKKIYLVIDPQMKQETIIEKLKIVITKDIAAVQIWDNIKEGQDVSRLISEIHAICRPENIPLFINNQWEYLISLHIDGVHFDVIPEDIDSIRNKVGREFIIGITCGNDLKAVRWAAENKVDYISFCSMFPSNSAGECEIIDHETIVKARDIFKNTLYLSGGIYPNNIKELRNIDFDGIAVISGVMSSENPSEAIDEYRNEINEIK